MKDKDLINEVSRITQAVFDNEENFLSDQYAVGKKICTVSIMGEKILFTWEYNETKGYLPEPTIYDTQNILDWLDGVDARPYDDSYRMKMYQNIDSQFPTEWTTNEPGGYRVEPSDYRTANLTIDALLEAGDE